LRVAPYDKRECSGLGISAGLFISKRLDQYAYFVPLNAQFLVSFLRSTIKKMRKGKERLTWWNGLHDLLSLVLIVDLQSQQVLGGSQLELGGVGLLVLLDGDSVCVWKVLLLSSHDFDEFLEVLYFLWLNKMCQQKHYQPTI